MKKILALLLSFAMTATLFSPVYATKVDGYPTEEDLHPGFKLTLTDVSEDWAYIDLVFFADEALDLIKSGSGPNGKYTGRYINAMEVYFQVSEDYFYTENPSSETFMKDDEFSPKTGSFGSFTTSFNYMPANDVNNVKYPGEAMGALSIRDGKTQTVGDSGAKEFTCAKLWFQVKPDVTKDVILADSDWYTIRDLSGQIEVINSSSTLDTFDVSTSYSSNSDADYTVVIGSPTKEAPEVEVPQGVDNANKTERVWDVTVYQSDLEKDFMTATLTNTSKNETQDVELTWVDSFGEKLRPVLGGGSASFKVIVKVSEANKADNITLKITTDSLNSDKTN